MSDIRAANGQAVTEEMIDRWCEALDRDEWPDGWRNVGEIISGRPPAAAESTAVISLKVPVGMKRAIEREAKNEGLTTSAFARKALEERLLAVGA